MLDDTFLFELRPDSKFRTDTDFFLQFFRTFRLLRLRVDTNVNFFRLFDAERKRLIAILIEQYEQSVLKCPAFRFAPFNLKLVSVKNLDRIQLALRRIGETAHFFGISPHGGTVFRSAAMQPFLIFAVLIQRKYTDSRRTEEQHLRNIAVCICEMLKYICRMRNDVIESLAEP